MPVLRYAVEEAVASLWRGRRSALLAVGTSAVALFVLGSFLLITRNLQDVADEWRQAAELSVFLVDEVTDEQRRAVEALLAPGAVVASHQFVSKAEAQTRFGEMFRDLGAAAAVLDSNPLPASYEVRLQATAPCGAIDALAARLRTVAGVS
ncbi:MAG: cell division protein FtsX, partial [Vicinamibacterales bacterium]